MSNRAEKLFVKGDLMIPGAGLVLDVRLLQQRLQEKLPDIPIKTIEKHYIRYKPGTSLLVRYQLQTADAEYACYAKAYNPLYSKMEYRKKQNFQPVLQDKGRLILDDTIEYYFFPNDAKLRAIRNLHKTGPSRLLMKELFPGQSIHRDAELQTLQYKPERRYVASITCSQGKYVLKAYRKNTYAHTLKHIEQLSNDRLQRFPKLLKQSDKHHILVFHWQKGKVLSEQWKSADFDCSVLKSLGDQLAEFHRGSWKQTAPPRKNQLDQILKGLRLLAPHLFVAATWTAALLEEKLQQVPDLKVRCHGDFYAKQILLHEQELYWLDLDDICLAHPGRDLGVFIAHLEWDVIRGNLQPVQAKKYEHILVERYLEKTKHPLSREDIHIHTALHLFKLSHHPFRNCAPHWKKQIQQILETIQARLRASQASPSRCRNQPPSPCDNDSRLAKLLDMACNPKVVTDFFSRHLPASITDKQPIQIREIKRIRYKPGKRCLIEYTFSSATGIHTLLGKIRAKGLHKSIYHINQRLYQDTFGPKSDWRVPEPVAMLPELNMWLQQKVVGDEFTALVKHPQAPQIISKISDMSHALHQTGLPGARYHSIENELQILEFQLGQVIEKHPNQETSLKKLLVLLEELARPLFDRPQTSIHRDFYPDQVIVTPDTLYLLDLDLFCIGDPCLDIGNFVAHLQEQALRETGDINAYEHLEATMIQRYLEHQDTPRHELDAIKRHTLISLARHIAISQRIPSRTAFTSQLVRACFDRLEDFQ